MEIRGRVVEINMNAEIAKNGGGTYQGATISFRDRDRKLQEKGFHANVLKYNAALKNGLENLQAGDPFVAQADKNDKGFWEWKSIAKGEAGETSKPQTQNVKSPQATTSGSNWATAEERAQTQVYIVRQSSLANALKYFEVTGNKKITSDDVLEMASAFEDFVLGKITKPAIVEKQKELQNSNPFNDMDDDIPF